jgi:aspartyl-tRNA(Asn)/glutamyl-tRNA(Gln) amidotransferase subunit A
VEDAALLLEVLAGYDSKDATTSTLPVPQYRRGMESLSPPRIGLLKEFFYENANEDVKKNIEGAIERLRRAGAEVVETQLPKSFSVVLPAHRTIMNVEAAAYHEDTFRSRMMDYRPNLRGMIASGLLVSASTYLKAQRIRSRFIQEIASVIEGFDGLLTPSTTTPAPEGLSSTGDPAFNSPWSFCGFPSITVPSGLTKDGLPLGIQLVGRPFEEERLLKVAKWCEKMLGFAYEPLSQDTGT